MIGIEGLGFRWVLGSWGYICIGPVEKGAKYAGFGLFRGLWFRVGVEGLEGVGVWSLGA